MRYSNLSGFVLGVLFQILLAPSSRAQLSDPATLLIFPEFDTRPGHVTAITVTNTSPTSGTRILFNYVDGTSCSVTKKSASLTPNDTLTVNAADQVGSGMRGYVYVVAVKGSNGAQRPIGFNHLVGTITHFDATAALTYSMNAIPYTSPVPEGAHTDVDLDGIMDLDGIEFQQSPDVLLFPRFVAETATQSSDLILIGLSGGAAFDTNVDFFIYNNNEGLFTAQYQFHCWSRVSLVDISTEFTEAFLLTTGDNPSETFPNGNETGWFTVNGNIAASTTTQILDPAVLGVLLDPTYEHLVELPFQLGMQNNGDLLPTGPGGDPH